jgi:hypothetical protein
MTSAKKDKFNIHFNSDEMSELETVLFETPDIPEVPTVVELMKKDKEQQEQIEANQIMDELDKINNIQLFHNNNYEIAQGIKLRWWQLKAMDDIFAPDNLYKPFYDMYLNDLSYIYKCIINNSQN